MLLVALQILLTLAEVLLLPRLLVPGDRCAWRVRVLVLALLAHGTIYAAMIFGAGAHDLYRTDLAHPGRILTHVLLQPLLVLALLGVALALVGRLRLEEKRLPWKRRDLAVALIGALVVGIAGLGYFTPRWVQEYFGRLSAEQVLFALQNGRGDTTADFTDQISYYVVVPVIVSVLAGAAIVLWRHALVLTSTDGVRVRRLGARRIQLVLLLVGLLSLVLSGVYASARLPIHEIVASRLTKSTYIENNYVDPNEVTITFPERKRNLIHIYMESIENSYFDRDEGGYMAENLMPELGRLVHEGVSFSNTDKFGGPHQTFGSAHSAAAMVAMWSGMPLKSDPFALGASLDYPDFTTLGDLLHRAGYAVEFMNGADQTWGNLGDYYASHGDVTVKGLQWARDTGRVPEDYHEWWGVEDDKLYEFAKESLRDLGSGTQPFYFILENSDTHFPDGYVSPRMTEHPFDKQYSNVIHYSQARTVELVRWIQTQPFYANTTIVITGDHQSMDKNYFAGWDPSYERTVVNVILNPALPTPDRHITQDRDYAPFDLFPTMLAAAGARIEGERLGLGTNLFSGRPTLVERDGLATVNRELSEYSEFYRHHMD